MYEEKKSILKKGFEKFRKQRKQAFMVVFQQIYNKTDKETKNAFVLLIDKNTFS